MVSRCHHPESTGYRHYGARGIHVVPKWHDRPTFLRWVAAQPGHQNLALELDRRDNDGPYAPWNCRLVDRRTNTSNRRGNHHLVFHGERITLHEFRDRYAPAYRDVSPIRRQLERGATLEEVIANQVRCRGPYLRCAERRAPTPLHHPDRGGAAPRP
jgi:hypothetical protein